MNKHLLILGIVILLLAVGLSGCEEVSSFTCDNRLVGIWESKETYMKNIMFFPDGTWVAERSDGTWNIEDGKLVIIKGVNTGIVYTYDYSFSDDNMLTLKDINSLETYVYKKR